MNLLGGVQRTRIPRKCKQLRPGLMRSQGINIDFIGNWARVHSCYIHANNSSTFCLSPKNVNEDKYKSNILHYLAEEISIKRSMHSVEWLLHIPLIQAYIKRKSRIKNHEDIHLYVKGVWKSLQMQRRCVWRDRCNY